MPKFEIRLKPSTDLPGLEFLSPNSLNTDPFTGYPFKNTTLNTIYVSFKKEDCLKTFFMSQPVEEFTEMYESLSKALGAPLFHNMDVNNAQSRLHAQLSIYNLNKNIMAGPPQTCDELSKKDKSLVQNILTEFECFSGVKFVFTNQEKTKAPYQISVCSYQSSENLTGMSIRPTEPILTQNAILLAGFWATSTSKSYYKNTIIHEALHSLGLDHTNYKNLSQQIKYRSAVANDDHEDSFISQKCLKHKDMSAHIKCLKLPTHVQPLDVVRLQKLLGPSENNSDYCKNIRDEFCTTHANVLEICGITPDTEDEL